MTGTVGETAVIIGNGPSLNETELELLTDVPTFGVNAIFLARDRLPKPITYYVVEDTMVFKDNLPAIKACEAEWKLFPAMYRPSFDDSELDDHTIFFRMNAGFYGRDTGTMCHPRFSFDADAAPVLRPERDDHQPSARPLDGLPARRPDRDGLLVSHPGGRRPHRGADHLAERRSRTTSTPTTSAPARRGTIPRLDRVLVNYHLADEIYRATGREIINATEGGKLDLFPRLSLREAIGWTG